MIARRRCVLALGPQIPNKIMSTQGPTKVHGLGKKKAAPGPRGVTALTPRNTDATPEFIFRSLRENTAARRRRRAWLISSVTGLAAPCSAWTKTVAAFNGCGGLSRDA